MDESISVCSRSWWNGKSVYLIKFILVHYRCTDATRFGSSSNVWIKIFKKNKISQKKKKKRRFLIYYLFFRSVSTRLAAGVWWFFTLIMVSCYTANLAAFLTTENPSEEFSNMDELAQQTEIKYGAKRGGTTFQFFNVSLSNLKIKSLFFI